ncbi:MAG TPA: M36 family metallopeptidase [Pyrinomonadaceae bacterium]
MQLKRYKVVPGTEYGTPKEVWGFRTRPRRTPPAVIAEQFIAANSKLLGSKGLSLHRVRQIESLGAHHVIFQQRLRRLPIQRAYITVHLGKEGSIYLVKNRAVPRDFLDPTADFAISESAARKKALLSVASRSKSIRVVKTEQMWFPVKSVLRPAYRVRIQKRRPSADWVIFVDGATGRVLRKYDNLSEAVFALVFDPNPVIALRSARRLVHKGKPHLPPEAAYVRVRLQALTSRVRIDGRRVNTGLTRYRVKLKGIEHSVPGDHLELKFPSSHRSFEEVMAYFHIDRAMGYLESLGYRGRRLAIFRDPLVINANGTKDDNSWYSPHDRSITFGTGGVDDAEDAEIILHEFGHAIQDAICPGFGQSLEAAAMGEGFGDYFAASFFADKKPRRYQTSIGTWDGVTDTEHNPPCVRRVDEPLTFESFDRSDGAEHENGQIWSAALWEIRKALGRDIADRIILESHFQLDGFTTFARGARAIIDADRNLYRGRNLDCLRRVFRRRGIGPVE